MDPRLTLNWNFWSSCLHCPSVGIIGLYRLVPRYPVLRGAGDWTQDSPHAKQALYQQSYNSNPASFNFQRHKYPLTSYILTFILYLRDLSRFEWWVHRGQGAEYGSLTEQCPHKLRHLNTLPLVSSAVGEVLEWQSCWRKHVIGGRLESHSLSLLLGPSLHILVIEEVIS